MNGGPGNEMGAQRAEQFLHLGNYTSTAEYCYRQGAITDNSTDWMDGQPTAS